MSVAYLVRMIQGNDTCTTVTSVEANTPQEAAFNAEMKWTGMTVKIVNVELAGECCYLDTTCSNDDHYCPTCETHLDEGECPNCAY
ncbi:hypothetical protein SEA_ZUKO_105 [Streptomyces phage Zuko]|uniref:Uncharacterized protein n=1 Tax=Streptomyces phage Zuko TaxID=2601695 RepID=A0A5J6D7M6_9CAUD|nr:hypothetical protein PP630_gp105 [Streptomyces phage Zuko]QEQ93683.1 hypothetical protein SEA_ZUKO_105 [Streptomyces phage Zuko]